MIANQHDRLFRFLFESLGIRGEIVRLGASWRAVQEIRPYPTAVATQLGQSLAAAALLATTIKLDGSLIIQAQGDGPLYSLVAQASDAGTIRGLARWRDDVPDGTLAAVFGAGRLIMTIDASGSERYQGIVALEGDHLGAAIDAYFRRSEQLPTRVWLSANRDCAAGIMLQRLPGSSGDDDDWRRLGLLLDTLRAEELCHLPAAQLLRRLFSEDDVRLFEPEPISFRCRCSRRRIDSTLRALGRAAVDEILAEQGEIGVNCEFCNRRYQYDPIDAGALFESPVPVNPTALH